MQFKAAFAGLSVNSMSNAKDFYTNILGLKLLSETMGLQLELPQGAQLFIYQKDNHIPATYTAINFVVDDIDEAVDALAAKGVVFEHYDLGNGATQDKKGVLRGLAAHMGPDIAWFKDPAGNILAILQNG